MITIYKVLYRKWRPKVFDDVIGQPQVTQTLKNELKSNRIAHAYLFTGSKGTGKTTCAKILAKAINCLNPIEYNPCGACPNCVGIEDGKILDVVEIDAASNNGVDNIRELRETASFTPSAAKYRVYIIDEVHMLSIGAFNALLKILEEPPEYVVFILATTEVHKLPATILSRCQRFEFKRIPVEVIAKRLSFIAKKENINLEEDAALMIARLCDGAMRDALSLLDQCMSKSSNINADLVCDAAGNIKKQHLDELAKCILNKNTTNAIEIINELYSNSKSMVLLCEELIAYFRDLMLLKAMHNPEKLLSYSKEEHNKMKQISNEFTMVEILNILNKLHQTLQKLNKGSVLKVQMEMTFIELCENLNEAQPENLQVKNEVETLITQNLIEEKKQVALKQELKSSKALEDIQSNITEENKGENQILDEETEKNNENIKTEDSNSNFDDKTYKEILSEVSKTKKSLVAALMNSSFKNDGNIIYIKTNKTSAAILLKQASSQEVLKLAAKKITGKDYIFKLEKTNSLEDNNTSEPSKLESFINDIKNTDIDININ